MSTNYGVRSAGGAGKDSEHNGSDSTVRYVHGKRQSVRKGVEYFHGKLPQGGQPGGGVKQKARTPNTP